MSLESIGLALPILSFLAIGWRANLLHLFILARWEVIFLNSPLQRKRGNYAASHS